MLFRSLKSFEAGAKSSLVVITSTAVAGIIIGIIDFTGLGDRIASSIVSIGGEHLYLVLGLVAVVAIILGMGMPPVPAYVMQAGLTIPALVDLGIPLVVSHLFVFYFSGLSVITPPIAVAAYAAAGLAGANPMKTGVEAFRIAIPSFIIPFMFVISPALLMQGPALTVLQVTITAIFGVMCMSVCFEGYLIRSLNFVERILFFVTGIVLMLPMSKAILPGFALLGILVFLQFRGKNNPKASLPG